MVGPGGSAAAPASPAGLDAHAAFFGHLAKEVGNLCRVLVFHFCSLLLACPAPHLEVQGQESIFARGSVGARHLADVFLTK